MTPTNPHKCVATASVLLTATTANQHTRTNPAHSPEPAPTAPTASMASLAAHPLVLGTFALTKENARQVVEAALAAGVRALDCAEMYEANEQIGVALQGAKRDDLHITSKLTGLPCGEYAAVEARAKAMLAKLRTQYVDLLLVHFPGPQDTDLNGSPADVAARCSFEWFSANIKAAWENMVKLRAAGLAKEIGVSNFYPRHLRELEAHVSTPDDMPRANQLYIDVCHQEVEFVAAMQAKGMRVMAYRSVAFLPVIAMCADMGDATDSALANASEEAAMTKHQLVVAWLAARGVVVVCGMGSSEHAKSNLEAVARKDKVSPRALDGLDGAELVLECGGADEFAMAFRQVAQSAE